MVRFDIWYTVVESQRPRLLTGNRAAFPPLMEWTRELTDAEDALAVRDDFKARNSGRLQFGRVWVEVSR